jgi:hypothetical protein
MRLRQKIEDKFGGVMWKNGNLPLSNLYGIISLVVRV